MIFLQSDKVGLSKLTQGQQLLNKRGMTWGILFFAVLLFHIDNLAPGNFDDLSVYRANAYISRFPHDPLLARLTDHLRQSEVYLANFTKYQWRLLKSADDYIAQQVLIRMFENL